MTHSIWDFSATPASNNMTVPQGWPEGQLPSTVNDCARELIAMVFEGLSKSTVAGGSADALTITFTNAPTAPSTLVDGMQIAIRAASANATNAPTLAINGGTARTITLMAGKAVGIGEWVALQELILRYNLANTRWELLNPITGLHLIQTQVASTSATIDFTTGLDGTYNEYLFSLSSIIPATNATVLNMRISTDAGSTWKAGATDYNWNLNVGSSAATNTPIGSTAATSIQLTNTLSNNTGRPVTGEMKGFAPASAILQPFTYHTASFDGTNVFSVTGSGIYTAGTAITGVRFIMASGNIASGSFSFYGLRK